MNEMGIDGGRIGRYMLLPSAAIRTVWATQNGTDISESLNISHLNYFVE